jgi:glutaredoxin
MSAETIVKEDDKLELKGRVTVFSISGCPHCRRAKHHLSTHKVPYVEINLDVYPERRDEMVERTSRRTVPQVLFNAKHIGGADDLLGLDEAQFRELVEHVQSVAVEDDDLEVPALPVKSANSAAADGGVAIACESDRYLPIVEAMREADGFVKDRSYHLRKYKRVFVGKDAVTWLVENGHATSREEAVALGNEMHSRHFFHHVANEHEFRDAELFYRFLADERSKALNAGSVSQCEPESPEATANGLRRLVLAIYEEFLSEDGRHVDYTGIAQSEAFVRYKARARELQRLDLSPMTRNEKLSFFVNVYNALVIHAHVELGHPKTSWQRYRFFNTTSYIIGGHVYSLNDIENGVLRGNCKPPFAFSAPFPKGDPRAIVALATAEPRIHFVLVCGAKSCPPVKLLRANDVDAQLTLAAQSFFEGDALEIDVDKAEVSLSKILEWYAVDFGPSKQSMLEWVLQFTPEPKHSQLEHLLHSPKKITVKFQAYDWSHNGD